VVGSARLPGHPRGIPARRDLQILDNRAHPLKVVAGMGTGPAGSADIDSGPLAASTIDLTGAWKEGVSETE